MSLLIGQPLAGDALQRLARARPLNHGFGRRFKPASISWRIASDTETLFVLA
jgi:hypothetical protein